MVNDGKLFVFTVPDSIYAGLGKFIALFMKLPFQKTLLSRIPKTTKGTSEYVEGYNSVRYVLYVADENQNSYHPSDNDAVDKLRQSKVIHICLTQNYVSLLAKCGDENKIRQYLGSFRNKYFLSVDEDKSAKLYSELCGKKTIIKETETEGESSHSNTVDVVNESVTSDKSSVSKGKSKTEQLVPYFEPHKFLELKAFQGIFRGHDGAEPLLPRYVYIKPFFYDWYDDYFTWIEIYKKEKGIT